MSIKIKQFLIDHLGFQPLVWFLLVVSVGIVLTVDLELFRIPEVFQGGHKFQNIFYQLSLGFVVSFWFYYFLVFREEVKERKGIEPFLSHEFRHYFREVAAIVQVMEANKNKWPSPRPTKYPVKEAFIELCRGANHTDDAHIVFANNASRTRAIIMERLQELQAYYELMLPRIFIRMRLADPELKEYLAKIERSTFFTILKFSRQVSLPTNNILPPNAEVIWHFIELSRAFSEYSHKKYSTTPLSAFFSGDER